MFKGAILFMLVFVGIAPQSRAFLTGVLAHSVESLNAWAPISYLVLLILLAAPVVSVMVVKSWPVKVEPENPMAKYRKELPFEE
jgi:hypothetical protein